jgi:hypothetical protein
MLSKKAFIVLLNVELFMKTLFDQYNCRIEYDENQKRLVQWWRGSTSTEEFRDIIDQTNQYLNQYEVDNCLAVMTDKSNGSDEDRDYAVSVLPSMLDKGVQKLAIVLPTNPFVRQLTNDFISKFPDKEIAAFDNLQEANDWLDGKIERGAA